MIGINPMGLSAPWDDSIDIIILNPLKKILWINPMGISYPWENYLVIIALQTFKNC